MSTAMGTASTSAALHVLTAGPGGTIQDGGRHGFLRFGVTAAGPMDALAHWTANHALGLPRDTAPIEVSIGGGELTAEGGAGTVASDGGPFNISIAVRNMPGAACERINPGQQLVI